MTARALRAIATLAVLSGVIWLAGPADLAARLATLHAGWVALAIAALVLQIWLSALRWQITARALGTPVSTGWALGEYHMSVLGNTLLPGGVLGDLGRTARARGAMGGWRPAAASVVIERIAGQIALAAAALAGLAWWLATRQAAWAIALALLAGAALLALALVRLTPARWRALAWRAWGPKLRAQIGLSTAIVACNLFGFWAAACAVGLSMGAAQTLFVIPLTLLSMLVPLTVNGWGLREGLAAGLWPMAGTAPTDAVAASIAFGLVAIAAALTGLVPLAARMLAARRSRMRAL
ncbi:hypothetical protein ROE7235_02056 [Roseibaca ekhonensis]|uniref:Flippase-like domain-containing protein n=1 Tax=Roseinatronobacter ekhonensis TaxID=254356 RepID=A0A3B0MA85_9RHOB|nr:lysylphosphatidylglycerol synthase transmembrane domain-containing protein [Roseibaca ekhonensis]SUZ32300.1 hypothetical protein ROE7235_02056 [Roseibaca ekhonensis]